MLGVTVSKNEKQLKQHDPNITQAEIPIWQTDTTLLGWLQSL